MKGIIAGVLIILLAVTGYIAYSSTTWKTYSHESYVSPGEGYETATSLEIINNPDKFIDKNVMVEGKISSICPTGCWFYLEDNDGEQIKVELGFSKFAIPPSSGKMARAFGKVQTVAEQPVIIGRKVQIR